MRRQGRFHREPVQRRAAARFGRFRAGHDPAQNRQDLFGVGAGRYQGAGAGRDQFAVRRGVVRGRGGSAEEGLGGHFAECLLFRALHEDVGDGVIGDQVGNVGDPADRGDLFRQGPVRDRPDQHDPLIGVQKRREVQEEVEPLPRVPGGRDPQYHLPPFGNPQFRAQVRSGDGPEDGVVDPVVDPAPSDGRMVSQNVGAFRVAEDPVGNADHPQLFNRGELAAPRPRRFGGPVEEPRFDSVVAFGASAAAGLPFIAPAPRVVDAAAGKEPAVVERQAERNLPPGDMPQQHRQVQEVGMDVLKVDQFRFDPVDPAA